MAYRISQQENLRSVAIATKTLNPAEAEIQITLDFNAPVTQVDFRGRLMGPRCPYAETVEIAYNFTRLPRADSQENTSVTGRIIIPEPSLWDPISPMLYQGPIELWSGETPIVQLQVSMGLHSTQIGPKGLRWNGTLAKVHAKKATDFDPPTAKTLRREGINTLVVPASEKLPALCDLADRFGFWLIIDCRDADVQSVASLSEHVSCLGFLVSPNQEVDVARKLPNLVGVSFQSSKLELDLNPYSFVYTAEENLHSLQSVSKMKLVEMSGQTEKQNLDAIPDLLGWVEA